HRLRGGPDAARRPGPAGDRAHLQPGRGRLRHPGTPQRRARLHLQGGTVRAYPRSRSRGGGVVTGRRWWLLGLAVVATGWIRAAEWVSIHHHAPENHFLDAAGGLVYLACGIVALDRRPGNAIGPLMVAYALVSYLGNYGNIDAAALPLLALFGG